MTKIKVDFRMIDSTASVIDEYITSAKKCMKSAKDEVNSISNLWKGEDSVAFNNKWEECIGENSTYSRMVKSFESYSQFLKCAGDKYKEAQINAINRANGLPRWW